MTDVAVCIPTIPPRATLLERARRSVAAQTRCPEQVVVAYDHGKKGAPATRQQALDQVDTEWVAFLDDDDELYPQHIENLLAKALETGADLVYPWFDVIGGTDPLAVPVDGVLRSPLGVEFGPEQAQHLRTAANFIPITFLSRVSLVREVGGFPIPSDQWWAGGGQNEDWGLLIALLDHEAKFVHLSERTWAWHHDSGNTSGLPTRW